MTRKQRIQAAKAFTEKEGGLEALAEHQLYYLADYYLEASAKQLYEKQIEYQSFAELDSPDDSVFKEHYRKPVIWAFNSQGIATTEF